MVNGIRCKLVDPDKHPNEPGDMWYGDEGDLLRSDLSNEYHRDWADKRPPLWVQLPNNTPFLIDCALPDGHGWIVTGEPPNITVSPSLDINPDFVDGWHGWLREGTLTPA